MSSNNSACCCALSDHSMVLNLTLGAFKVVVVFNATVFPLRFGTMQKSHLLFCNYEYLIPQ